MGRYAPREIEHPEAYHNAVRNSIHGRANAKRWRAFAEAHPHLAEWIAYTGDTPAIERDEYGHEYHTYKHVPHRLGRVPTFVREACEKWGAPHEKAVPTLQRIYDERKATAEGREAQRAAEAASALPWEAGRQVVEGTVVSIKETEGFARYYGATPPVVYKWLVKRDDGSRIFATIPSILVDAAVRDLKGKRVRFTATVEPKAEEPTFAFGSRPAKGEILTTTQEG